MFPSFSPFMSGQSLGLLQQQQSILGSLPTAALLTPIISRGGSAVNVNVNVKCGSCCRHRRRRTWVFNQTTVATTWAIAHNLGDYPSVTVVDPAGHVMTADVEYVDDNNVLITFTLPVSGKAYLN